MKALGYEYLQETAGCINTGTADPDTSRALVVFNLTDSRLSGSAVFHAYMSWPADTPLPPVVVTDMDGQAVPSALTDLREASDKKGRADRRQLSFSLRFAVQDVPPQGWRTYLAAYVSEPVTDPSSLVGGDTPGLTVVETLRHDGAYTPTGIWLRPNPLPDLGEGGEPQRAG